MSWQSCRMRGSERSDGISLKRCTHRLRQSSSSSWRKAGSVVSAARSWSTPRRREFFLRRNVRHCFMSGSVGNWILTLPASSSGLPDLALAAADEDAAPAAAEPPSGPLFCRASARFEPAIRPRAAAEPQNLCCYTPEYVSVAHDDLLARCNIAPAAAAAKQRSRRQVGGVATPSLQGRP